MALKTTVKLTGDIDGSDAAETIGFGLDGQSYEIDLNEANAGAVRQSMQRYVDAGRRARPRPAATKARRPLGYDAKAVRFWAAAKGIDVSPRGRVPADVITRYDAAGN